MTTAILDDRLAEAARRLVGAPVERCQRLGGGRNARVFRIDSSAGTYALKQYPSLADDARDRLSAERKALLWMEAVGIATVPRFLGADEALNVSLLSWKDGALVNEVGVSDIDQATDFIGQLQVANAKKPFPFMQPASEACMSGSEIERQLLARLARLKTLDGESELKAFLDGPFTQAFEYAIDAARHHPFFVAELAQDRRCPVAADFGFHNALRDARGKLSFLDFEYFGWDDPVKLSCDFLLHPGTAIADGLRARLHARLVAVYADDVDFPTRLAVYLPLFALRWALILLNEFHPERWRQRVLAGTGGDWEDAKTRQLEQARMMLKSAPELKEKPMLVPLIASRPDSPPLDERSKYLRRLAVRTLDKGGRGHIGSTMSLVEILRVLYDGILHYRADEPNWPERDRFILSKGHGCIAQYVLLADKGFFPVAELDTFCHRDSILGGHPEANKIPGVEASTGALGHGLSIGIGMALAARVRKQAHRVVVVMGDGEINEGSVWEAALAAGKHKLANLTAIIDYNKIQSAGFTRDIQDLEPLADKWRAFGFSPIEVEGHDVEALKDVLTRCPLDKTKPTAIICHTVKGKGIPFAENDPNWHHKAKLPAADIARLYQCLE